jgi:phosphinothricin acetyltransferase
METNIRPAKTQDVPFITAVYNESILKSTASFRYSPVTLEERTKWLCKKEEDNFAVLVAEKGDALQGFASLAPFRLGEGYRYTVEHSVYVSSQHQRQGVAKCLLKALIQNAKKNKMHNMVAGIDTSNIASHSLHRSLGFQECGTLHQVGKKFGKWLDLTFYSLILSEGKNMKNGL